MATTAKKRTGEQKRAAVVDGPDDVAAEKMRAQDEALRELLEELHEKAEGLSDAALANLGGRLLRERCPGLPEITFETRDANNVVRRLRIRAAR